MITQVVPPRTVIQQHLIDNGTAYVSVIYGVDDPIKACQDDILFLGSRQNNNI